MQNIVIKEDTHLVSFQQVLLGGKRHNVFIIWGSILSSIWLLSSPGLATICDFESGFCNWTQSLNDSFNWSLTSGQTFLAHTGPSGDHTTGNGFYAYIEARFQNYGEAARLIYGPFSGALCVRLYYNMNGNTMGTLNIYLEDILLYSVHGDHLDRWIPAQGIVFGQNSLLILEGVVGPRMFSDLAIDDIDLSPQCNITCPPFELFSDGNITCTKGSEVGSICTFTCSNGQLPIYGSSVRRCTNFTEWTGKQPSCKVALPTPCTFDDNSFCDWKQELYDEFDWSIGSGYTPSSYTGPNDDHTTGEGSYMFIEASRPRQDTDRARLIFRHVYGVFCFSLYYHMYGDGMGWLNIYFDRQMVFTMYGHQGDDWTKIEAQLNGTDSEIVIEGVVGYHYTSDLAVDDIYTSVICNVTCPVLSTPVNGTMACTSGTKVGSVCKFTCLSGVILEGSSIRTCDTFGSWTGEQPLCAVSVRLVGGATPFEGRVQVYAWQQWLAVCDYNWRMNEARVLCRMLNLPEPSAAPTRWAFGPGDTVGWMSNLNCNGSESTITDCDHNGVRKRSCHNGDNAAVVCGALWCPKKCRCNFTYPDRLAIDYTVDCGYSRFTLIPKKEISFYTRILVMEGNELTHLEVGSFYNFSWMHTVNLANNKITHVDDGAFLGLTRRTDELIIDDNDITELTRGFFKGLEFLFTFSIKRNKLQIITNGTFVDLGQKYFVSIYLDNNLISVIEEGSFSGLPLSTLSLQGNKLHRVDSGLLQGVKRVSNLYLNLNSITFVANDSFPTVFSPHLRLLAFGGNKNLVLPAGIFDGLTQLSYVDLSLNNLLVITSDLLKDAWLGAVSLSHNGIKEFGTNFMNQSDLGFMFWKLSVNVCREIPFTAAVTSICDKQFINGNSIQILKRSIFQGTPKIRFLDLSENPLEVIEEGTFAKSPELEMILLIGTNVRQIGLSENFVSPTLQFEINPTEHPIDLYVWDFFARVFLDSMGYHCRDIDKFCVPCTFGTFKRGFTCEACPAGGFYQESMAQYIILSHGFGCNRCPPGTFVSPEKAPGRSSWDCSSCPEGTDMTEIAEFRACYCLTGYYRFDRFGPCLRCERGYVCSNETILLAPGFYWRWVNPLSLETFVNFTANVKTRNNSYLRNHTKLSISLPNAYPCPVQSACHGGLESHCAEGYEGALCAVCSTGYYKLLQTCQSCPSYPWLVVRAAGIIFAVVFTSVIIHIGKQKKNSDNRSVTDVVLARLKITIGFYQVTSGTVSAFSYVKWPTLFLKLLQFTEVLQLNLLQVVPVHCFKNDVRTDPYSDLILFMAIDTAVVVGAIVYYLLNKVYAQSNPYEGYQQALRRRKERCLRIVFLVLFMTYPVTCLKIFQILPSACHMICSSGDLGCSSYLQADYSTECHTDKYANYVILAYFSLAFPVGFPAIVLYLVWKYHHKAANMENRDGNNAIGSGIRFVYENYSSQCWFWEVIELVRKVILTSVLALVGAQGRTYLGTAAILSGFYAVLFAHFQPVSDRFENSLMLLSLTVTNVNQNVGLLLKVPQDELSELVENETDDLGITALLILANLLIIVTLLVRYGVTLARAVAALRRNPRCSVHCCLYVLQLTWDDSMVDTQLPEQTMAQSDEGGSKGVVNEEGQAFDSGT